MDWKREHMKGEEQRNGNENMGVRYIEMMKKKIRQKETKKMR
jgi:hypothetical protein